MLMAMRRTFILGATAFALLAGACGSSDTQTPAPVPTTVAPTGGMMGGGGAGIANPASEFCVAQGGTVELETDANGGQLGYCKLPDGRRIEEWEYYRSENPDLFASETASPSA